MRAKKTRHITPFSKINVDLNRAAAPAAKTPNRRGFGDFIAMAHAMAHVSARMQQRAEVREYFRRWAVMDDEADSALMAAFKSEWKRKNTLQAKIFTLNKKLLTG